MKLVVLLFQMIAMDVLYSIGAYGQVTNDFKTHQSGNWDNTNTWERYTGSGWEYPAAHSPTQGDNVITIQNTHTVTCTTAVTIDQTVVDAGGQITLNDGITLTIANGGGTDLSVSGILKSAGSITINASATITFNSGGKYQHNFTTSAGTIPSATWDVNSTCEIIGYTTNNSAPSGLGQSFGNFTWNCASQTDNMNFAGALTTVNGDFTFTTSNTATVRLATSQTITLTVGGNFTFSSGTLEFATTSGSVTLTITGDYSQTGGTVNLAPSSGSGSGGTVKVGGNFSITITGVIKKSLGSASGKIVFNKSSGTHTFSSTSGGINSNVISVDVGTGSTTNTLSLSSDLAMSTSATATLTVFSGSTLDMGTNVITGNTFSLNSGGTIIIGSTAGITSSGATGNIQVIGTRTYSTNADYTYNGGAAQVTGNGLPSTTNNLTINNSNGLSLSGSVNVSNTLTLTSGRLILGANNLTLGTSASVSGTPSASNMIVADGSGELRKSFSADGSFVFPVGDNTGTAEYSPVDLSSLTASGYSSAYVGVKLVNVKHTNNGSVTDWLKRYWTLSASGITSPTYTATFNYVDADINGTESNLHGGKYSGSTWTYLGAINTGNKTFTAASQTTFSDFTAGEQSAMPVELTSFSASLKSNKVYLRWKTATEVNNYGFEIVRARCQKPVASSQNNDVVWEKVGFIQGHGTVNTPQSYSFIDQLTPLDLTHKTISYRLKQIDRDGKYEYSSVVKVTPLSTAKTIMLMQNYPNPFSKTSQGISSTNIAFSLPREEKGFLVVYDVLGNEVARLVDGVTLNAGNHVYTFFGNGLPIGMYLYELRTESGAIRKQMILEK